MSNLEIAVFMTGLAALAAIVFFVGRMLEPARQMRLMRCPETDAIAFVNAESITCGKETAPEVVVQSCEFWPERKHCTRGCLERYEQTAPGFRINVEALRSFERPSSQTAAEVAPRQNGPISDLL